MIESEIPHGISQRSGVCLMLVTNRAFPASLLPIVALQTTFFRGKVVVGCLSTILCVGMAILARCLDLCQMETVGKYQVFRMLRDSSSNRRLLRIGSHWAREKNGQSREENPMDRGHRNRCHSESVVEDSTGESNRTRISSVLEIAVKNCILT